MLTEYETKLLDCVASPVFVLEIDDRGLPVYVAFNETAREVAGLAEADVIGKTADAVYPGPNGEAALQRHRDVARDGEPATYELMLPLRGGVRRVRTTLWPLRDGEDGVMRLVGSSQDVTAERAIEGARLASAALHDEIARFVTLAAHDLRSPMRNIGTISGLLKRDFQDLGDGKIKLIDMLEDVANRSMTLITDMLSHADAREAETAETEFDFAKVAEEICGLLDPSGAHEINIGSGRAHADLPVVQVVLRNLIDNAIKHAKEGRMRLDIGISALPDGRIAISVDDDGPGFPQEMLTVSVGGPLRASGGYGLHGIRQLLSARGGTLELQNRSPRGGRAIVTLPGVIVDASA